MKKCILTVLTSAFLFAPIQSFAAGISVGGTVWYQYWENSEDTIEFDPDWMYGPALAVAITDNLRINTVFYYGEFDTLVNGTSPGSTERYDSDTSLGYRIHDYVTILAGFKYMHCSLETTGFPAMTYTFDIYGPAVGGALSIPLIDYFSLSAGLSGIYMWEKDKIKSFSGTEKNRIRGLSYNSTAALVYFIQPASVTLSIGGRYQYYKQTNADKMGQKFYGITASAVYSFSL